MTNQSCKKCLFCFTLFLHINKGKNINQYSYWNYIHSSVANMSSLYKSLAKPSRSIPLYILLLFVNFVLFKQKHCIIKIYYKLKYMKICIHFPSESQQKNIYQSITGLLPQFINQTLFRGFPPGHLCLGPFQSLGGKCQFTSLQWELPVHEMWTMNKDILFIFL